VDCGCYPVESDRYVSELLRKLGIAPECIMLGCTHCLLVANLKAYLDRHPEHDGSHAGRRKFLLTGVFTEALPLIQEFWGAQVPFVLA
jgi:hypothetical protein